MGPFLGVSLFSVTCWVRLVKSTFFFESCGVRIVMRISEEELARWVRFVFSHPHSSLALHERDAAWGGVPFMRVYLAWMDGSIGWGSKHLRRNVNRGVRFMRMGLGGMGVSGGSWFGGFVISCGWRVPDCGRPTLDRYYGIALLPRASVHFGKIKTLVGRSKAVVGSLWQ